MTRTGPRRRTPRTAVAVAVIAAAIALVWLFATDRLAPSGEADLAAPGGPSLDVPSPPDRAFALTVDRVIDGDTIRARAIEDNPVLPTSESVSIRLIGIDTAETYPDVECWGPEAGDALRALAPEGTTLWGAPDLEWHDRYDRVLLYLWTEDGTFVNHELVARGDAEALRVEPNSLHAELFAAAESAARAADAGQWGACF